MLKVWFYKGTHKSRRLYDTLVRLITRSRFSHVELEIEGVCFAASKRDGGTRMKMFSPEIHPDKWECVEVPCSPASLQMVKRFTFKEEGSVFPLLKYWYSAEVVAAALKAGFLFHGKTAVTPGKLFQMLGGKP